LNSTAAARDIVTMANEQTMSNKYKSIDFDGDGMENAEQNNDANKETSNSKNTNQGSQLRKIVSVVLGVTAIGFMVCASLATLSEKSFGLGKRINEQNLSWRADERMDKIERVTNPGGRRSKKKDVSTNQMIGSNSADVIMRQSHLDPKYDQKEMWELSEYASAPSSSSSREGRATTVKQSNQKKQFTIVDAMKETKVMKEDADYERPQRRSEASSSDTRKGLNYLGLPLSSWEPPSDLPESFDVTEKWPECASFINEAWDQGECGSCWAIAPTKVMSDRLCIASNGRIQERLAASEILSCGQLVSEFSFGSCEGGMPDDAYEFAKEFGVASGGKYGDETACAAYPFPPCHHPCHVQPTPQCPLKSDNAQCLGDKDEHTRAQVAQHIAKLVHCPDGDYDCMAREIYNSGPVSSYAGTIYDEFYAYKDGAYRTSSDSITRGRSHGGHVIEVVGWQKEDDGTYSWKIINSWLNWGDKGHGRVTVGELSIGDSVESAVMQADTNLS